MPLILDPEPRAADLRGRLDDFRRRLRRNVIAAGGLALAASIVGFVARFNSVPRCVLPSQTSSTSSVTIFSSLF